MAQTDRDPAFRGADPIPSAHVGSLPRDFPIVQAKASGQLLRVAPESGQEGFPVGLFHVFTWESGKERRPAASYVSGAAVADGDPVALHDDRNLPSSAGVGE